MARPIGKLIDELYSAVEGFVQRAFDAANERINALERRLKEIPAGPAGKDGAPGRDGVDGKEGAPGRAGVDGKDGAQGKDGRDGVDGKDGAPGKDGRDGIDGKPGPVGLNGDKGEKGDSGKDGAQGKDGAPGKDGRNGIDGKDGAPGRDGKDGEFGKRGEKGEPGRDGREGKDGRDGKDGINGKDGAPGKDALEIEILPAINQERVYARGTWARHDAGIWRAVRETSGLDGWECFVPGVAAHEVEQVSERNFAVKLRLSGGDWLVKSFAIPVVIDRGVYQSGTKYQKGDGVTFGGSFWIAQMDEPTFDPGYPGSTQWRLAVKRGRDGKDAAAKPEKKEPVKLR